MKTFVLRDREIAERAVAFIREQWSAAAKADKPLSVMIATYRAKRTLEQNARYWEMLARLADRATVDGRTFTADAWAEHCKRRFLGGELLPDGGVVGRSTTGLSVAEFGEFMDRVEAYAADELGVDVWT